MNSVLAFSVFGVDWQFLKPFIVIGLAFGGVYALSGVGLVVLYRATGVLNLAFGAVGAMGAFIAYSIIQAGGRRVKHTGDGVMASFTSVTRAVEAAIAIQRAITARNASDDAPFDVRIAVSAGEPVTEDDDLFGAAVQLAARVCSTCDAGRILVSSAVRELCLGKGFKFHDKGTVELKGFDEPMRIYDVAWD